MKFDWHKKRIFEENVFTRSIIMLSDNHVFHHVLKLVVGGKGRICDQCNRGRGEISDQCNRDKGKISDQYNKGRDKIS